jgi:hypothetical protein
MRTFEIVVTAAQKMRASGVLALILCSCVAWAADPDSGEEELRAAVAACAAPLQVTYEISHRAAKPSSERATTEETERVRAILQEANLPDDPAQHRATYEATLSMLRAAPVLRFRFEPQEDSAAVTQARQCLEQLAKDVGFIARFGTPARKVSARKAKA